MSEEMRTYYAAMARRSVMGLRAEGCITEEEFKIFLTAIGKIYGT